MLIVSLTALAVIAAVVVFHLRSRPQSAPVVFTPPAEGRVEASPEQFNGTNSVFIRLGEEESGHGLKLIESQNDGRTEIEDLNGVTTRVGRLVEGRTTVYFYFQIHPSFKQQDMRGARIEVEYLDPEAGMIGIHYDGQDAEDVPNPIYREAVRPVRLTGSNVWQKATFRTRNDAAFDTRQNGRSDFRLWARTPILYVRRVTVTLEAMDELKWAGDFSASNQVSIALGEERLTDGLRHMAEEGDGMTRVETLKGVVCRHLNRVADNKQSGYLYFSIHPGFKRDGLNRARVDVEYLAPRPGYIRLQFDGMEGETRRKYLSVLPAGARPVRTSPRQSYARIPTTGVWTSATFHVTNAVFQNGQNGDADFRVEPLPPELYIRRITVTRE